MTVKIGITRIGDSDYPRLLKLIKRPPEVLYYRGDITLASQPAVAIVGTRKASGYGKWAAYELAGRLADYGVVSVSGMALGIDSLCHKGSLDHHGKTIAVLGSGVDICYPASNKNLMERILQSGLILSEQEPETHPLPYMFPLRNRIISGISLSTTVIEAGLDSGSLITAEYAMEQGRNIYAVPGNINSIYSIGTNKLIRDGAMPITTLDDIIEDLGIEKIVSKNEVGMLSDEERAIYEIVGQNGEMTKEMLCFITQKKPTEMNVLITILEMKGFLQTALGKIYVAK